MPLQKLPTSDLDNQNHRKRARETINSILDHQFDDSKRQTSLEKQLGITPVNTAYPPGNVLRYGAKGDGATNDYQAIRNGIDALGAQGGVLFFPPGIYKVDNTTIDIETMVVLDGGCANNGGNTTGAILYSTTNVPLLRYPNTNNRFVTLRNLTLVGDTAAGSSQDLLTIDNMGVHVVNCRFRNAGRDAIRGKRSVGARFTDIYSSGNVGSSFHIISAAPSWGANTWLNCNGAGDTSHIWNIEQCDGADTVIGCAGEQSTGGYGIRFGADVLRWRFINHYSELNSTGSAVFDASSNYNWIDYQTRSGSVSEAEPVNSGGTGNRWSGWRYTGATTFSYQGPRLIQRVYKEYTAVDSGNPNALPPDDTVPQSNEGRTVMSETIIPQKVGNRIKVTVHMLGAISAGTQMTIALFYASETDARCVSSEVVAVDTMHPLSFEYDMAVPSPLPSSMTFSVNLGSDNAAATVTFNGVSAGRKFGAISKSHISLEEFWP